MRGAARRGRQKLMLGWEQPCNRQAGEGRVKGHLEAQDGRDAGEQVAAERVCAGPLLPLPAAWPPLQVPPCVAAAAGASPEGRR